MFSCNCQILRIPRYYQNSSDSKNLKLSLKLGICGPQSLNHRIVVEIATHLVGLAELNILNNIDRNFDRFYATCCCHLHKKRSNRFSMEITPSQFAHILRAREKVQAKVVLMIYHSQGQYEETTRLLTNQLDAHKNVLQLLPLQVDGFFNFFTATSVY